MGITNSFQQFMANPNTVAQSFGMYESTGTADSACFRREVDKAIDEGLITATPYDNSWSIFKTPNSADTASQAEVLTPKLPEHTGLPVAGYQPQSDLKVQLVNTNKKMEEEILRRIDMLRKDPEVDQRWLSIAQTDIEKGFMALNRSIFRPQRLKD